MENARVGRGGGWKRENEGAVRLPVPYVSFLIAPTSFLSVGTKSTAASPLSYPTLRRSFSERDHPLGVQLERHHQDNSPEHMST